MIGNSRKARLVYSRYFTYNWNNLMLVFSVVLYISFGPVRNLTKQHDLIESAKLNVHVKNCNFNCLSYFMGS